MQMNMTFRRKRTLNNGERFLCVIVSLLTLCPKPGKVLARKAGSQWFAISQGHWRIPHSVEQPGQFVYGQRLQENPRESVFYECLLFLDIGCDGDMVVPLDTPLFAAG